MYRALRERTPELIILDIMLPGEDGISILKKLRGQSKTADIPIIIATAKDEEYNKVLGLDSGADDYLTKPFGMMEMISRVKAVLRRTSQKNPVEQLQIGNIVMNLSAHSVTVNEEKVSLTLKEYELLVTFMRNPGIVYT